MATYTPIFTKPYNDGYEDLPSQDTPITAQTLNDKDDTLVSIESYLQTNPILDLSSIATAYDNTSTYAVGDIVSYGDAIYQCNTAVSTAEDFDSTKWTEIGLGDLYADKEIYTDTGIHMGSAPVSNNSSSLGGDNPIEACRGFASGQANTLTSSASHSGAIGYGNTVSASNGFATGSGNTTSASNSRTGGLGNTASSDYSVAEGLNNVAQAPSTVCQGEGLIASSRGQFIVGKYNVEDNASTYQVIVGNGTSDNARSNALTVSTSGDVVASGEVTNGNGESISDKIDKTASKILAISDGQFTTVTGGLMQSCVVELEPVQSGSGTPSPDNIRPITGHTTSDVWVCGKNLLPNGIESITRNGITVTKNADGTYTFDTAGGTATAQTDFYINVDPIQLPDDTYTFSGISGGSNSTYRLYILVTSSPAAYYGINDGESSFSNNGNSVSMFLRVFSGATLNNVVIEPMIRLATDTDSTFEPYKGKTYSTALNQTVYGGTVDLVSGELTITHGFKTFDGSENWSNPAGSWTNQHLFRISNSLPNSKIYIGFAETANIISNLENATTPNILSATDYAKGIGIGGTADSQTLYVGLGLNLTLADFKTYLAINNLQICYELATPITVQLSQQQIKTLIGSNTITATLSGQSITQATYRELMVWDDVESVTDSKADITALGLNESGNTVASQAYTAGQYFYKDGFFCEVTTAIAQGGTLTENTNYTHKTIAEILTSIIAQL